MTDFVVGARFDVKTNELVGAAKASTEQLDALKKKAEEAAAAVDRIAGKTGGKAPLDPLGGKSGDALAGEIAKVEAALGRYLAKIDPAAKAIRVQAEGQALLDQALKLGVVTQAQYETGLAKVTKEYDRQRITTDALTKGKLSLGDTVRLGTSALAGLAGGLAGTVLGLVAGEAATLALKLAQELLAGETDEVTKAHERLGKILESAQLKGDSAKQSSQERARLYKIETENLRSLAMAEIDRARAAIAGDRAKTVVRGGDIAVGPDVNQLEAMEAQRRLTAREKELAEMEAKLEAFEFKRGYEQPSPSGPAKTDTKRGTGARASTGDKVSDDEKEWARFTATVEKASRALDEYAAASRDIIEKAEAELSGRREITLQIQLEAEHRKKFGAEISDQARKRIAELAQERAAAERVANQYRATAQFLESSAGHLGNVLEATLALSFDHSADAVKNWEGAVVSSLRQVAAELQRLAIINPLINAIAGNNKLPTAYGQGGLIGELLRWLGLGGGGTDPTTGAPTGHEGRVLGEAAVGTDVGQVKYLPPSVWARAPRAHAGLGPDEMPIVAKRGEGIFTPRQMDNADSIVRLLMQIIAQGGPNSGWGGGGDMKIEIVNQGGTPLRAERAQSGRGAGGERILRVFVIEATKSAIAGGELDGAMQQRFGAKAQVT